MKKIAILCLTLLCMLLAACQSGEQAGKLSRGHGTGLLYRV